MLRFGTDGVRGVALREITPSAVQYFARAAARALRCTDVVVGHDPRESSPELARAVAEGFRAEGVTVAYLGMAPTPTVAFLAAQRGCAGAVVTASHNPYTDNGVKFFRDGGVKLTDDEESAIQRLYEQFAAAGEPFIESDESFRPAPLDAYVDAIVSARVDVRRGMRVVVDCANGAMSAVAPTVLGRLGVDTVVLNAQPNGTNINVDCGAAHPDALAKFVKSAKCDIGVSFDGDGDRLIAVTPDGVVVDGDHLIAIAAKDLYARGLLANNAVVVTVMSNMGFQRAMSEAGISVYTTPVGDRSVLLELERTGAILGGEQSGHIIHREVATTGDGLLAAVRLLSVLSRTGTDITTASESAMTTYPQVLINVRVHVDAKSAVDACGELVRAAEAELGSDGRVLVRASGTEPLVRVMVEATSEAAAQSIARRIADFAATFEG